MDSWADPKTAKVRLYYTGWSSSTGEADWHCVPCSPPKPGLPKLNNMSFYSNDVVDGGIAKALVSTDDNEQAALYKSVQEQLMKGCHAFLWSPRKTCLLTPSACRAFT